jgi:hypothetical protein
MTDRLALADVIEDGGIERAKAVKIATAIFDAIHDNVATKTDIQALDAKITAVRADLSAKIDLVEHRLLTRLGGLAIVMGGVLFAALRYWPPHS